MFLSFLFPSSSGSGMLRVLQNRSRRAGWTDSTRRGLRRPDRDGNCEQVLVSVGSRRRYILLTDIAIAIHFYFPYPHPPPPPPVRAFLTPPGRRDKTPRRRRGHTEPDSPPLPPSVVRVPYPVPFMPCAESRCRSAASRKSTSHTQPTARVRYVVVLVLRQQKHYPHFPTEMRGVGDVAR